MGFLRAGSRSPSERSCARRRSSFSSWSPSPRVAHRGHREGEITLLDEVVGLDARDDAVADLEVVGRRCSALDQRRNETSRRWSRSFSRPNTLPPRRLKEGDLALDPHGAPRLDEAADRVVQAETEVGAWGRESRGCTVSAGGACPATVSGWKEVMSLALMRAAAAGEAQEAGGSRTGGGVVIVSMRVGGGEVRPACQGAPR